MGLPDDILIQIFQFFQLTELSFVPQLSKKWKENFYEKTFWLEYRKACGQHNFLNLALFYSVKNKRKSAEIERYLILGANPNIYTNTFAPKNYPLSSTCIAFFTKATPLSIVANSSDHTYAITVISALLRYGANPTLKSTYSFRWFSSPGYLTEENVAEQNAADSAIDKKIHSFLLLAIHQFLVKNNAPQSAIVSSLKKSIQIASQIRY